MRWVSLHTHTTMSFGDGYGPPRAHVERVAELGMKSVAFTEHGNVTSHVQLEKAAKDFDIKPIYGMEAYCAPPGTGPKNHQILLAENEEGYRNLNRMVTESWVKNEETKRGFYKFPTIHADQLARYSEGIIVTSGCADSLLSCTLLGGKFHGEKRLDYTEEQFEDARRVIEWYQEVFGDRYYLEVQRFPELERACILNPAFERLAAITGAELVGTADVHYPNPEDNEMQRILHAAHRGGTVESVDAAWEYDIRLTYPLSDREMLQDLRDTGLTSKGAKRAILNSERIAERCNVELPKNEPIKFPLPANYRNSKDLLMDWLREGWGFRVESNERMQEFPEEYGERIEYELERIIPRGFVDYFLMLSDAVRFAKDEKIPVGPARGSAASSLVLYLLRVTEVDPLQHPHMMFERFIDPTREELPDVDLDFADHRREEVRQHLARRYGSDRVGNISNYTQYKGKNSIDDVARVYQIPKWDTEQVKDRIIERSGGDSRVNDSLQDTFDSFPEAQAIMDKHPDLKYAIRLEGNTRGMGVHAAGLVISNSAITDTCALYQKKASKTGNMIDVLPYDKKDAEYIGMLKADFLGLATMGAIGIALDVIGMDLEDLYRVPLTDPETLDSFRKNDVVGIFQFEGRATRLVCGQVKPDNFQELADINALSRPGPLFSGMTAQYIKVKHGEEEAEELHPIVDELTSWTKGQIIYQEQVLTTIKDVGGFPMTRVHDIRKIISQKLGQMNFEAMYKQFEDGARDLHGIPAPQARKIWNFMVTSATYSFNIAHCISYSMLAFWSMWLKVNHPVAFYTGQLNRCNDLKQPVLMRDAIEHGVDIAPPDPALSELDWTADVEGSRVVAGWSQVPGVGPKTANTIMDAKAGKVCAGCAHEPHDGPCGLEFRWGEGVRTCKCKDNVEIDLSLGWEELGKVSGIGPKTLERIVAFCESPDPFKLKLTGKILHEIRNAIFSGDGDFGMCPMPTHTSDELHDYAGEVVWLGRVKPKGKEYKDFLEDERARSGKTAEEIMADMKDPDLVKSCTLHCYDDGNEDVYVRFNRWRFPEWAEELDALDPKKEIVLIKGKRNASSFGISIQAWELITIDVSDMLEE